MRPPERQLVIMLFQPCADVCIVGILEQHADQPQKHAFIELMGNSLVISAQFFIGFFYCHKNAPFRSRRRILYCPARLMSTLYMQSRE